MYLDADDTVLLSGLFFWGGTARELKCFGNGVGFHFMETVSIN